MLSQIWCQLELRKASPGDNAEVEGASADMRLQMGQWASPKGSV